MASISTIQQILGLDELQVGDHVAWSGRRSPVLVVKITTRAHESSSESAVAGDLERRVGVRGEEGGEWTLHYHDERIITEPATRYGWIDNLYRVVPGTPISLRPQSHPPAPSCKAGGRAH